MAAQHANRLMMKAMDFQWNMDTCNGWCTQFCLNKQELHYRATLPV